MVKFDRTFNIPEWSRSMSIEEYAKKAEHEGLTPDQEMVYTLSSILDNTVAIIKILDAMLKVLRKCEKHLNKIQDYRLI